MLRKTIILLFIMQLHNHHTDKNIRLAFLLNLLFTIVSIAGGICFNSQAIISEAIHNLSCTLTIGSAWFFQYISSKPAPKSLTFGAERLQIIGAIISVIVLSISSISIIMESIGTIAHSHDHQIMVSGVLWMALRGIVVKGFAALRTAKGANENERLVSVHMLADMMGWVAILITAIVLHFTHLPLIDSALSIAIATYIMINVVKSAILIVSVILDKVPNDITVEQIKQSIDSIDGVSQIDDIKLWSLDGEHHAVIITLTPTIYSVENNKNIRTEINKRLSTTKITQTYLDIATQMS